MVYQPNAFTKCFSKKNGGLGHRPIQTIGRLLLAAGLLTVFIAQPALALVKMEPKTIDAALVYGMQNQKRGLSNLLGNNWVEGENGALLNVYSPFMMLAVKASKAGLPSRPAKSDLEKARKRFGKDVAFYSDPNNRLQVKFSVSFYGNAEDFAKGYKAKIVGSGRGQEFEVKPFKQSLDEKADAFEGGQSGANFEAINAYYFHFADLENMEDMKLVMESPSGPPVVFHMRNERLY